MGIDKGDKSVKIRPEELPHREVYKLLTGAVVPRPIAWVSTVSEAGENNLAPFSFFTAVCALPPTLLFCTSVRLVDGKPKDTLTNIRATGEFTVNVVTEPLAEAMNITAIDLPADVDEFKRAGLTPAPGTLVKAPYVVESPIHFECKLNQIVPISDEPGGGSIVIGTVVYIEMDDRVWREGNHIDFTAYEAIGRLTGAAYCRVNDLFDMPRLPPEIPPGG
ncbi:MAG: flavin reductase family protein [Anaerolineaceae bacterium]|nr:flavin reductase family protein [Anaerolineaceae bacterium]